MLININGLMNQGLGALGYITLSSSANPSIVDATVTYTATGIPGVTGTVTFFDNSVQIGLVQTLTGTPPTASVSVSTYNVSGAHNITAQYSGGGVFLATTLALTQFVLGFATTTSINSSNPTPSAGDPIVFSTTVTPASTGNVELWVDGLLRETKALAASAASFTAITNLSVGSHAAFIKYLGDTRHEVSQSTTLSQNVLDIIPPSVTINQAAGQVDPANSIPINFTAVFSEPVIGFTNSDVTITGTASGGATAAVTGGPTTYNIAVSPVALAGNIVVDIFAGVCTDLSGNPNTGSTSTDNTVTLDRIAPTVTINQGGGQVDPTSTSPIIFTVTFSEAVTGFVTGDVTLTDGTSGALVGTVSGGSTVFTVSVAGMGASNGVVTATIAAGVCTDLAGNPNSASTSTDNSVAWIASVAGPTVQTYFFVAGQY